MNTTIRRSLVLAVVVLTPMSARGQTVQGDVLRGQGRYLEGAGWYNLNTAAARSINVETWKSYNREVQRIYRDYMMERHNHMQFKKGQTNKLQAEILRKFEEDQRRWRESPTAADVASGDALNALAGDLADPSITPSSWRTAKVDLPSNLTLTALAFKIADNKKAKIQQSTVAVDRMLVRDRWPLMFRRPEIERECDSYEKAITAVVEKCRKGTELQAVDYDRLRESVTALQKTLETAVPPRDNQRSQARDYVRRLDEATKIFTEQAYAERLIRDVSIHRASNVAELLAFMRDYRLMFADPGSSPEVTSLYDGLYGLLRRQKDALGIRDEAPSGGPPAGGRGPAVAFVVGSVWVNGGEGAPMNFRVVERFPRRFRALFAIGKDQNTVREINGHIDGDVISWEPDEVRVVKAPPQAKAKAQRKAQGGGNRGTIRGDVISFTFNHGQGKFLLRKVR